MRLEQGSQTSGPPDAFVRAANIPKNDNLIKFSLFWGLFLGIASRKSFVLLNCGPRSILFLRMWPSGKFEFEIPGLECAATVVVVDDARMWGVGKRQSNCKIKRNIRRSNLYSQNRKRIVSELSHQIFTMFT